MARVPKARTSLERIVLRVSDYLLKRTLLTRSLPGSDGSAVGMTAERSQMLLLGAVFVKGSIHQPVETPTV